MARGPGGEPHRLRLAGHPAGRAPGTGGLRPGPGALPPGAPGGDPRRPGRGHHGAGHPQQAGLEAAAGQLPGRAYIRRVLENDEGIVTIGETASEICWDRDRGLREVVKSRRTTRNLDAQTPYASTLQGFVDFYDDDIPMAGHTLIGPTHPEALDHYRFRLAGRRHLDDRVVFDISVEPRSRLAAAFSGRVAVLDGDFVLLEADLAPSRAALASLVPLPVVERLDVSWRQQFRGFGEVWLPVDQRFSMEVGIGMVGLRFPTAAFTSLTRLDDYEVNVDLPDSLYAGEEVLRVDSLAVAGTAPSRGWRTRCRCPSGNGRPTPPSTAPCGWSGPSGPAGSSPAC